MSTNVGWRELYRAALLELSAEKLRQRIDEAEGAILQRIVELRQGDSDASGELLELNDALWGLRVLASTECTSSQPASCDLTPGVLIP